MLGLDRDLNKVQVDPDEAAVVMGEEQERTEIQERTEKQETVHSQQQGGAI